MATHHFSQPVSLGEKLDGVAIDVAEIQADLPTPDESAFAVVEKPHIIRCPPGDVSIDRPRDASPACSVRSSFDSTRVTRRRTSHRHGHHRSEVSKELSFQAETEFSALMELMTGISRRSISLREVWSKIISERDSCYLEMDRMCERIDEYTEIIERKEREWHSHNHEHEQSKTEIAKLKIEITAALASVSEFKQKLSDRDCELGEARREIAEQKDVFKYLKEEKEKTETTLQETSALLVLTEERCKHAEDDAKKHECELRDLKETYYELEAKSTETSTKYESMKVDYTSVKQSYAVLKKEKHEWLHEKGELEEHLRKCHHKHDETKRKLKETIEYYEKKEKEDKETIERSEREVREVREKVIKLKSEKKELEERCKVLVCNYDEEHCRWEDAEERCGKWKLKWEHAEREITSIREELRVIESKQSELKETITKKTEELKRITKIKEHLERDYHGKCKEAENSHREILVFKESIRRHETTIKEKSEEIHTLSERIERLQSECESHQGRCTNLEAEITSLQAVMVSLKAELSVAHEDHDCTKKKLHECETRYESICETYEESQGGHSDYEYQLTQLRTMLREARSEKERAIKARTEADHERDEAVTRYEAKCRDLEEMEEFYASRQHEHHHKEGRRTIRASYGFRSVNSMGSVVKSEDM
ncbi:hypothetical protein CKM354_000916700 [Cercospora kikuchii]|uniref:Uncharacterized protein n=1 Tax=Cercospora kikuchii TaxID=84275 RepID=A0A9P3CNG3_9PEZI|nr:uncharacterized protein CKM354_000916700 [Cercospora kikuchii]GIZ46024.1 hypothetical protein CKM354_000916700 [Cercospora kikuchii]